MPTTADTPVAPRVRFAPIVLLTALGLALGGLSLTGGAPTSGPNATSVALSRALREGPSPVALAPAPVRATSVTTKAAQVRRTPSRASRSRAATRWVRPSSAAVVSRFGMRWGRMHEGIDFGARYGASIRAVGPGVVIGAGYLPSESGYGQIVLIRHRGGVVTAYAHMSKVLTRAGKRVEAGDVIGRVGSTGHSTGPHLHFEVRVHGTPVDPRAWLRRHGVYV